MEEKIVLPEDPTERDQKVQELAKDGKFIIRSNGQTVTVQYGDGPQPLPENCPGLHPTTKLPRLED